MQLTWERTDVGNTHLQGATAATESTQLTWEHAAVENTDPGSTQLT